MFSGIVSNGSECSVIELRMENDDSILSRKPDSDTIKMFVGQIPRSMNEDQLRELFEKFGPVYELNILRDRESKESKGCCFVTFYTRRSAVEAQHALHNIKIMPGMHYPIQMKPADTENRSDRRLFVGMISKSCQEDDIRKMFEKFGPIEDCTILRDADGKSRGVVGCAFVTFEKRQHAQQAIMCMHNSITMENCRSPIVVKLAYTQKDKEQMKQMTRPKPAASHPVGHNASHLPAFSVSQPVSHKGGLAVGMNGVQQNPMPNSNSGLGSVLLLQQMILSAAQSGNAAGNLASIANLATTLAKMATISQQPQSSSAQGSSTMNPPPPVALGAGESNGFELSSSFGSFPNHMNMQHSNTSTGSFASANGSEMSSFMQGLNMLPSNYGHLGGGLDLNKPAPSNSLSFFSQLSHNSGFPTNSNSFSAMNNGTSMSASQSDSASASAGSPVSPLTELSMNTSTSYRSSSLFSRSSPTIGPVHNHDSGGPSFSSLQQFGSFSGLLTDDHINNLHQIAGKQEEGPDGANLFIYHLPQEIGDFELAQLFAPFGTIVSAKVFIDKKTNLSKCFGFVSYDHPEAAQNAISAMNGFNIGNKRLKVQLKKAKLHENKKTF